jgi:hypothetical protein
LGLSGKCFVFVKKMFIAIKGLMLRYVKEYCSAKKLTTTSFPKSVVGNPFPGDYQLSFVKVSTNLDGI